MIGGMPDPDLAAQVPTFNLVGGGLGWFPDAGWQQFRGSLAPLPHRRVPEGVPPPPSSGSTGQIGCSEPYCPCGNEEALVARRQDHLGVAYQPCRSQVDGVIATEAHLLSQTSRFSNEPLGDLDHVELLVEAFEVVDCFSQPPLVDSVESTSHCQGRSTLGVDET